MTTWRRVKMENGSGTILRDNSRTTPADDLPSSKYQGEESKNWAGNEVSNNVYCCILNRKTKGVE